MRRLLLIALAGMLATGSAYANSIILNFTGLPQNIENGTYNGFATGTINSNQVFVDLICDDYHHTTYVPSGPLTYTVSTFGSFVNARFSAVDNALEKYREAAIIVRAIETPHVLTDLIHPPSSYTTGDLQYALWNLFSPGVGETAHSGAILEYFAHNAAPTNDFYNGIYSSLVIYTPTAQYGSNQEFLSDPVPEPATMAMFGIGIVLLRIGYARRRRR